MNQYFDLVDLRLFAHIVEQNSLTKGAALSCMSAPAASVRVRDLEQGFGTRLLDRTRNGVTPTPAGQALLQHANLMLDQVEVLNAHLRSFAEGNKGNLRIAASTSAMNENLPPVLSRYMKLHPDVSVAMRPKLNKEVQKAVSDNLADVGIYSSEYQASGVQTLRYLEDRFVLITSVDHPLASRAGIALAEALDHAMIGFPEYSSTYAFMSEAVDEKQLAAKTSISVDSYDTMFRMIEENVGIGVTLESAARRYARSATFSIVPLADQSAVRHLSVCARDFDALPVTAKHFVDLLIEETRKQ